MNILFESERFSLLGFGKMDTDTYYQTAISQAFIKNDKLILPKNICTDLESFFLSLGSSDIENEQKICRLYFEKFKNYEQSYSKSSASEQKLSVTLGILGGIFAAVMLI